MKRFDQTMAQEPGGEEVAPAVSVVISTFNHNRLLSLAL